ncbi:MULTISPECIES: hypothetical protein [unclassified Rhodococcus (in: high G+C Gram-positive bacteria)]|uniref:hypothetical protein n=1 Tax=unclassified Rhodococcus (in: high G+C Gram-positive bacteria) TaxID=192944 RepID=UPI0020CFABA3|nr:MULTISPECIES: hypothetical protein [unclassified Rhodococcus (in: high G+C Gram-positive bacteria)]
MRYHPWRRARDDYPEWEIDYTKTLPDGVAAKIVDGVIFICASLTQAARRSALGHELEHIDRGSEHDIPDSWFRRKEEQAVDIIAARKLIELDDLVEALTWTRGLPDRECAWELWTDVHTLTVRIAHLTPDERRYLSNELERRQL